MQRIAHEQFRIGGGVIAGEKRINVIQGSCHVSAEANVLMTTVLGSCVACCLYDPQARLGGMNHFLLASPKATGSSNDVQRYGLYAMEMLINEMLKAGAAKHRLRAHLYGGANIHSGMTAIGTANAEFAVNFLKQDGIPLIYSHLGGAEARRADFRAASGKARCRVVPNQAVPEPRRQIIAPPRDSGDVELF
jgi:chemotaxis protein CheD